MRYLFATMILALFLAVACASAPAEPATPAAETVGEIAVQTGGESPETQPTTEETAPADGDAKAKLDAIFKKGRTLSFKVDYDFSSSYAGQSEEGKMSLYMKGQQFRTDMAMTLQGQAMETRSIVAGENEFYTCTKQGSWQCFKFDAQQEEQQAPVQQQYDEEGEAFWESYGVVTIPDRTIAGAKASCFRLTVTDPSMGTATEEYCYSKEGVPLYVKVTTPEGTTEQIATAYSTSVPSDAFTPPAEAQSFDEMMQQYGVDPSAYT